jgi:two-component system cell cycle sensor histidine kinase/response regulator CckA
MTDRTPNDAFCTVFDNMEQGAAFCQLLFDGDEPQDFEYKSVNAAFKLLIGLNDVVGRRCSEVIPGIRESNPDLFTIYKRVALTGSPEKCETFIEPLGIRLSISVYRPQAEHFITIFHKVAQPKYSEQPVQQAIDPLAKAEGRYQQMFNSGSDAVFVHELGGDGLPRKLLEANDNACRSLGYTREVLLRMRVVDIIPHEEAPNIPANAQRLLTDGHLTWEGVIVAKGGRRIPVDVNSSMFDLDGSAVMISVVRDITARKDAESAKTKLEEQLRQAQKLESVGRLAGGVAHDFNNLLTVINGYSDFLVSGLNDTDPLRQYAEQIKEAGERAAILTRQLLAFSRKQVIQPRAVDLNRKVRVSAPMLERLIGEDIELETHLDGSLGAVMADPEQIQQVIMNLVVNARDAMPDGGKIAIETMNVELNAERSAAIHPDAIPGQYVLMTVTDTGKGMDKATRQHIFEPFFTTKELGKGTGLGLATVYGIIRQSGGWIDVWSALGAGASFKIYLPRIDEIPLVESKEGGAKSESGTGVILLVEDQKAVRSFTKAALMQYGYHVIEASSGSEAIDVAKQYSGEIRLLLTDVVLAGMNGKDLSERLKELRPSLKVLFVSGYTADAITHRGVLNRGVAFLPKPFSPDELAAKVRDVLAGVSHPIDCGASLDADVR